jgi:hypothetical protein
LGFSGLVRGVGWQKWGVNAKLGAQHYGVGLPTAIILVLVFHFNSRVCEEHHITFL